jgi:uncharacterized protein YjbI with pentapeptide repeats
VGDFSSADYTITVEFNSNTKETVKLLLVASPNSVNIINYGNIGTLENILSFSVAVNNSYVSLLATANPNFQGAKIIFTAQYSETISDLEQYSGSTTVVESPLKSEYGFQTSGFSVFNGNLQATSASLGNLSLIGDVNYFTVVNGVITINSKLGSSGSMNNVIIGDETPVNGSFTNLSVTTTANFSTSGIITIDSGSVGTINNIDIGLTTPGDAEFVDLTAASLTATDISVSTAVITTANLTTLSVTTETATNLTATNLTATNLTATNLTATNLTATNLTATNLTATNLTAPSTTVDDIVINNQPTLSSHGTRKDYVDATATALAIALGS